MTVLITLTIAGLDVGPFNLYSNIDGFTSAFEIGVTRLSLISGYTSTVVPNGTVTIRVVSTNPKCTNYIDIPLMPSFCNCITFTSNNSFPGNYTYTQCSTGKEVTDIIPAFGIINVCGSNPSVDIEAVDILLDGSCVIDGECSTITTTSTTTTVTPTTTSTTTSALTCHTFTLYGGSLGRTFNFRQCGETDYINVNVPGGDSVTYCIRMPYFAAGAIDEGDCTP